MVTSILINIGSGNAWWHQAITWTDSDMLIVIYSCVMWIKYYKCLPRKWIWKFVCKMSPILFMPRFVNGFFEQTEIRRYSQVLRNFWVNWRGICYQYEIDLWCLFCFFVKKVTFDWSYCDPCHIPKLPGPLLLTWIDLIPAWISNYIHYKVWDEITYPFPNFNGCTVEVWEWITNFIPHFTRCVMTYPCWD